MIRLVWSMLTCLMNDPVVFMALMILVGGGLVLALVIVFQEHLTMTTEVPEPIPEVIVQPPTLDSALVFKSDRMVPIRQEPDMGWQLPPRRDLTWWGALRMPDGTIVERDFMSCVRCGKRVYDFDYSGIRLYTCDDCRR